MKKAIPMILCAATTVLSCQNAETKESGEDAKSRPLVENKVEQPVEQPAKAAAKAAAKVPDRQPVKEAAGFRVLTDVIPDAVLEIRYFSDNNFIGRPIDGYEQPTALITKEAAAALKLVADDLRPKGYRLKIFDAYRPQAAVNMFMRWAADPADTLKRAEYYPMLTKKQLIPGGYIARRSGHSRGSTVDLTLVDAKTGEQVDMGGPFDFFGDLSHPSYPVGGKPGMAPLSKEQYRNRQLLRSAMKARGFKGISSEWWHFTLVNEPYPRTYFTFPVNAGVVSERK